jgi:Domain of unknown function (DUF4384)
MTGQLFQEKHIGELALRRFRAGEAFAPDDVEHADVASHAAACGDCRARLKALDDEQRRFEGEISFDRFAAGVARAARSVPERRRKAAFEARVLRFFVPVVAVAAVVALFVGPAGDPRGGHNSLKGGGAGITVRVAAGEGPQRTADELAPEALAAGERVRIGYQPGAHRYLLSVSIDERGQVTPLYPETGRSVSIGKAVGQGPRYLPDSIEFTDAGTERLFVILSDAPIDVDAARRAARASFDKAKGDILHMPALDLPGEQFQRTFIKP